VLAFVYIWSDFGETDCCYAISLTTTVEVCSLTLVKD